MSISVGDLPFSCFLKNDAQGFYNQSDYIDKTREALSSDGLMPTTYRYDTEYKIIRFIKQLFSCLVFPIGIYNFLHTLAGKFGVLPSSTPSLLGYQINIADIQRREIPIHYDKWKFKRITVETDGYQIDVMIVGKPSTFENGRWTLFSNGNGEFYEQSLSMSMSKYQLLASTNSNGILFNYPGVGASSGFPSREAMIKAYQAMLVFLEDEEKGIGAKEIIGFGHSIGGGVQGDALRTHELKETIRYVFVKSRTFYELSAVVSEVSTHLGTIATILGWNLNPAASSLGLRAPEIVLQTARVNSYTELEDSSTIITDGVIPAEASLAKHLLDSGLRFENKKIIGIRETHNEGLDSVKLAEMVLSYF